MFSSSRGVVFAGILLVTVGVSLFYDEFFLLSQPKAVIPSVQKPLVFTKNSSRDDIKNATAVRDAAQIIENGDVNKFEIKSLESSKTTGSWDAPQKVVSILLDQFELEDDDWFARLAFAKLLQLEAASHEYDIPTEIVVVVRNKSSSNWTACFPNMQFRTMATTESKQEQSLSDFLERKELEQTKLLGPEKALLLKATADSYRDGLYLIRQSYRNATTEYDEDGGGVSVPFFTIDVPPNWSEWKRTSMDELKRFMQVSSSCCSATFSLPSVFTDYGEKQRLRRKNESVVYVDKHTGPLLPQMMELLSSPNGTSVVLLGSPTTLLGTTDELMKDRALHLPVEAAPVAGSLARYCMLQQHLPNGVELVASLESPLAQWVSVTRNDPSVNVRLVGNLSKLTGKRDSETPVERSPIVTAVEKGQGIQPPPHGPPLGHPDNPVSLVIHLGGEMGNQISTMAHGYSLKWMLEEDYNISAIPILRHQKHGKWMKARDSMVKCFPNIRYMNFEEGNVPDFDDRISAQRRWLGDRIHDLITVRLRIEEDEIRESLETLKQVLSNTTLVRPVEQPGANLTLPFLQSSAYAMIGYVNDRFYDRLRDLFRFDFENPLCCGIERPQANETVLHIRGYNGEMGKKFKKKGYEELSPNKTRDELLGGSRKDETITILSRYASTATPYVETLQGSGWKNVRFLETETGEQSFCYLMRAQKEMIGFSMSSFTAWGALMGNATKTRIYSLKSPERIAFFGEGGCFFRYNYTNPSLRDKMSFELYSSELQELEEQRQTDLLKSGNRRRYNYRH